MTNHDSLHQTDSRPNHNTPPSPAEVSHSHFLAVGIGLAAILAMTAAGCMTERLSSDKSIEVADPEMRLRTLAREAILSGPGSPNDIVNMCTVDMNGGSYKAMYTAIDDAIWNHTLPGNARNEMDRASYVSIETSAVIFNETLHDHATNTSITLFYKDIDSDNKQEILGVVADSSLATRPCRTQ